MRDDDSRTDAVADAAWKRANDLLFPPTNTEERAPRAQRLGESRKTPFRRSPPPRESPPAWRLAQEADLTRPVVPTPWTRPTWQTSSSDTGPEPDPVPYLSHRRGTICSGTNRPRTLTHTPHMTMNQTIRMTQHSPRSPRPSGSATNNPEATHRRPSAAALLRTLFVPSATSRRAIPSPRAPSSLALTPTPTSLSPIATSLVYDIRPIDETVQTGAGEATYSEEG